MFMASQEYYYNLVKKQTEEQKKKDIANINKITDANKKLVEDSYGAQISDTNASYEELHKKNEAQRLLNQRYVERKASEMGLTDSGFNRTQQTASQLAYSNQQGNLLRDQQKAVDTLALAMRTKTTELDMERNNSLNSIENSYNQYAIEQAEKLYDDDVTANAKITAANISAQSKKEKNRQEKINELIPYMLKDSSDLSDVQKGYLLQSAGEDLEAEDYLFLLGLATGEVIKNPYDSQNAVDIANWRKLKYRFGLE